MKTVNNFRNKSAFMAQYWGQFVFQKCLPPPIPENHKPVTPVYGRYKLIRVGQNVTVNNLLSDHEDDHLSLKPLSLITETELQEVFSLASSQKLQIEGMLWVLYDSRGYFINCGPLLPMHLDLLREKGYAVPWRDLSIEDLLKYEWIVLKR